MSIRITRTLIDDIDGDEAEATVTFSYMGQAYEVDLNTKNGRAMHDALKPYIEVSRRITKAEALQSPSKRNVEAATSRGPRTPVHADNMAIREWAQNKGIEIGTKGRIPAHVREQYQEEMGAAA